jgi:hypothetical protein
VHTLRWVVRAVPVLDPCAPVGEGRLLLVGVEVALVSAVLLWSASLKWIILRLFFLQIYFIFFTHNKGLYCVADKMDTSHKLQHLRALLKERDLQAYIISHDDAHMVGS